MVGASNEAMDNGYQSILTIDRVSASKRRNVVNEGIQNVAKATVDSGLNAAIGGADFWDTYRESLIVAGVNTAGAAAATQIGQLKNNGYFDSPGGYLLHKGAHGALGCAMGAAISGDCASSAAAAVAAEVIAESLQSAGVNSVYSARSGKLASAFTAFAMGADEEGVYTGYNVGNNAVDNNFKNGLDRRRCVLEGGANCKDPLGGRSPGVSSGGGKTSAKAGTVQSSANNQGFWAGIKNFFSKNANLKADTLKRNKENGRIFEEKVISEQKKRYKEVGEQITIKTQDGTKTRVDILAKNKNGKVKCIECKSSQTAPLTKNQRKAFPEIEKSGGVILGKGKPGFEGGKKIPPTKIEIIRK